MHISVSEIKLFHKESLSTLSLNSKLSKLLLYINNFHDRSWLSRITSICFITFQHISVYIVGTHLFHLKKKSINTMTKSYKIIINPQSENATLLCCYWNIVTPTKFCLLLSYTTIFMSVHKKVRHHLIFSYVE